MAVSRDELKRLLRTIVREAVPEIAGIPYSVQAKVAKVHASGAVDLRVLGKDGLPAENMPVLPLVQLPAGTAPVAVGTLVRVGFYYNDPGLPYIDAVLGG